MRLNLGSGPHPHPGFVNVDLNAAEGVIAHDVTMGIPFPDRTFDLVYHSTMLSHLRPREAAALTAECLRVLKPGGVLRVVTEDLERMCRTYLQKLEDAWAGRRESADDYDWMILELYDQATREYSGGRMFEYLAQDPVPNVEFICARFGPQGRTMLAAVAERARARAATARGSWRSRLSGYKAAAKRAALLRLLGPQKFRALALGQFRLSSGEVTHQMYDRFSLMRLLLGAGFLEVALRNAAESGYAEWRDVNVDLTPTGEPVRPHALIMEGVRAV